MTYQIKFPVGDWSEDGHCQCKWFTVASNKPVEEVREAHFAAPVNIGIEIGEICKEYQDNVLNADIFTVLRSRGFDFNLLDDFDPSRWHECAIYPEGIIHIWLFLLVESDPTLELKIIEDKTPTINQYGYNEKGRHLVTPGYGTFYY